MNTKWTTGLLVATGIVWIWTSNAFSHCDTAGGPVISEARTALESDDPTPILKWIKANHEPEVRAAFEKAMAVRTKGPRAQELADAYFIETLVRLHRTGEGAPYTGIKDEPVEPIIALADKALADGSPDDLIKKMTGHMAQAVREKFQRVAEAQKHKDESVEAGREFVEAYVIYTHYVEGIHAVIMSAGEHPHAAPVGIPSSPAAGHAGHVK